MDRTAEPVRIVRLALNIASVVWMNNVESLTGRIHQDQLSL